jgi:2-polyprenyl-6-methoxyphenol hydroxylase-like FAD-dependent oxidoreductase
MSSIGIVGAGVSALHLGLRLRQHDIPVTIHTDRSADQLAAGRLLNTVAHHHPTLQRERQLGVHHWDAAEYGYVCHHHYVGGPQPLVFRGDFVSPSSGIDYRLYLPRLMADFEARGGSIEIRGIQAGDLDRISDRHDLLVVASGGGPLSGMFPRRVEKSPYDRPQRRLCVALYRGVTSAVPKGVSLSVAPGHGELLELPIHSIEGDVTALLFECIPGGDQEILADLRYDEDPQAFERAVLLMVKTHYPTTFERIDNGEFGVTRPQDMLQGALTPQVRRDYTQLANGRFALAVGDAHVLVDPLTGQGGNSASYSAWTVGEAILEDIGFDELFCQRVARRRAGMVEAISDWTNLMLAPPPPHLLAMFVVMSQNKSVADEFTINFGRPERQWSILATPERTRSYLQGHGVDMDELLLAAEPAEDPLSAAGTIRGS